MNFLASIDPRGITMGPNDYAFHYKDGITTSEAEQRFPIAHVAFLPVAAGLSGRCHLTSPG